jgi:hypothetical protein
VIVSTFLHQGLELQSRESTPGDQPPGAPEGSTPKFDPRGSWLNPGASGAPGLAGIMLTVFNSRLPAMQISHSAVCCCLPGCHCIRSLNVCSGRKQPAECRQQLCGICSVAGRYRASLCNVVSARCSVCQGRPTAASRLVLWWSATQPAVEGWPT